jgi:DnaK suppressor protein
MMRKEKERQERLREILREEKRRLWQELRSEIFRDQEKLHSEYDIPQDIGEQSMLDVLSDTGLAVADILRERLTRMEEAERKLEEGTFGMCEDCGVEIEEERLRVIPYAVRCVRCQERSEGPSYPPEGTY